MGCGILFPRDYNPDAVDSDGSRDSPDVSDNEDYLDMDDYRRGAGPGASSDSEDERWWERAHMTNSGTLVQVRSQSLQDSQAFNTKPVSQTHRLD